MRDAPWARPRSLGSILLAVLFLAGCEENGERDVLTVGATGFISGVVYVDENGNSNFDDGETRLEGVRLELRSWGPGTVVALTFTDAGGIFRIPGTPVGTYRIEVDRDVLGDSFRVEDGLSSGFTVMAGTSLIVDIGLHRR